MYSATQDQRENAWHDDPFGHKMYLENENVYHLFRTQIQLW